MTLLKSWVHTYPALCGHVAAAGATIACPVQEKPGTALALAAFSEVALTLAAFSEVALALEGIDSARLGSITQPSMLMP